VSYVCACVCVARRCEEYGRGEGGRETLYRVLNMGGLRVVAQCRAIVVFPSCPPGSLRNSIPLRFLSTKTEYFHLKSSWLTSFANLSILTNTKAAITILKMCKKLIRYHQRNNVNTFVNLLSFKKLKFLPYSGLDVGREKCFYKLNLKIPNTLVK
jgi:hypothetical protein